MTYGDELSVVLSATCVHKLAVISENCWQRSSAQTRAGTVISKPNHAYLPYCGCLFVLRNCTHKFRLSFQG